MTNKTLTIESSSVGDQPGIELSASEVAKIVTGSRDMYSRSRQILALVLTMVTILVALAVRLANLRHEAVDGDELFSRRVALMPIQEMLPAIRADLVHPPLYYFILKIGTTLWGSNALGIRLWSILFGILLIPLTVLIGSKLSGGWNVGLLAAAMLTLNTDMIFYSQQARSYMLYTLLTALLYEWISRLGHEKGDQKGGFWVFGCVLMAVLVYTHYVAAVYVFCVVIAILMSHVTPRAKLLAGGLAGFAALSFVPWLVAVSGVYRQRHGLMDWQGHPTMYDLKALWASAVGILEFRGATTVAIIIVGSLLICALILNDKGRSVRDSPLQLSLLLCSFLPPLIMFVLSINPINLRLFGPRHLLPSVVALTLICSYGLERLAAQLSQFRTIVFCIGGAALLGFAATSTLHKLIQVPTREPYDRIAQQALTLANNGQKIYTTWVYGVGDPVNFYCQSKCVDPLPKDLDTLPRSFYLLYRPNAPKEEARYQSLTRHGLIASPIAFYTNGRHSPWGTQMVLLSNVDP